MGFLVIVALGHGILQRPFPNLGYLVNLKSGTESRFYGEASTKEIISRLAGRGRRSAKPLPQISDCSATARRGITAQREHLERLTTKSPAKEAGLVQGQAVSEEEAPLDGGATYLRRGFFGPLREPVEGQGNPSTTKDLAVPS